MSACSLFDALLAHRAGWRVWQLHDQPGTTCTYSTLLPIPKRLYLTSRRMAVLFWLCADGRLPGPPLPRSMPVPPGAPMAPGLTPSGLPVPPARVHSAGRGRAGMQMALGAAGGMANGMAGGVPGLMHTGNMAGMGRGVGVAGRGRGRGKSLVCRL
jgi:hypothetical protein